MSLYSELLFNGFRYHCKIVEVDWGELDILVHYERWSNRFDEWLKMDSTRIRSLSRSTQRYYNYGSYSSSLKIYVDLMVASKRMAIYKWIFLYLNS